MSCKIDFPDKPNSYWITSSKPTNFPELKDNITVDVAVIGGGIAGISSAYLLSQAGLKVAVIEANHILHGTTGHTTAKLTSQHSFIYAKLIKEQGEELARQYAKANDTAIHTIAKIAAENKIDCDFIWQPAHLYTSQDKYLKEIEDEIIAARSLGIKADFVEAINLPITIKGAMRFSEQAQYHPVKFLRGLSNLIIKNASHIYENTEAIQILDNEVISRQGYRVKADKIIIATHYPFFDGGGFFFSKIYQDRTYILGITIDGDFPEGYYINAETPTRSLRSQPLEKDKELVLVAGEHHKSGQGQDTDTHYQNLLNFAHETFKVTDVPYRWSTQDCMT
ncbi:MAG: FAD-binding oxidoreductase, partial [Syntrophomonadaceae bacterium]|nr:FAD-binding oxidoreductase [Syntrophomonadaceae bacterium]